MLGSSQPIRFEKCFNAGVGFQNCDFLQLMLKTKNGSLKGTNRELKKLKSTIFGFLYAI